jgi:hypothetical protein
MAREMSEISPDAQAISLRQARLVRAKLDDLNAKMGGELRVLLMTLDLHTGETRLQDPDYTGRALPADTGGPSPRFEPLRLGDEVEDSDQSPSDAPGEEVEDSDRSPRAVPSGDADDTRPGGNVEDRLRRLQDLLDAGLISRDEFDEKRAALLDLL